jgi:hypothetical protein
VGREALSGAIPVLAGIILLVIFSKVYDRRRRYEIAVQTISGLGVGIWFLMPFPSNHWWFHFPFGVLLRFLVSTLGLVPVR